MKEERWSKGVKGLGIVYSVMKEDGWMDGGYEGKEKEREIWRHGKEMMGGVEASLGLEENFDSY